MKYYLLGILLVAGLGGFAQSENLSLQNNPSVVLSAGNATQSSYGGMLSVNNPRRIVDGTVYLFDEWENLGQIYTTDNRKLIINNINLNVKQNVFESKIVKDSLFLFSFNNIDRFEVNNKVYRNFYWDGDNRVYQVLYESNDFQVIKGFRISLVEGSANPMLNRSRDKYILKERYYVKSENKIEPFKLKKSSIHKLLQVTKEDKKRINSYVKENGLSYKDEDDIPSIIGFALSK